MKKEFIMIIVLTSIIVFISLYFGIFSSSKYMRNLITEEEWNNIIDNRKEADDLIKDLRFNNQVMFKDKLSNTYFYTLTTYTPNIYYKSINGHAKFAFKELITDELIEDNKTLKMLIYTKNKYTIIDITVTRLPIINISKTSDNLDKYKAMMLTLYDGNNTSSKGFIKYRGASTYIFPKKSYRINLDEHINMLGLRKDNDWILYSAYNDQEKIRNAFASQVWYQMSSTDPAYNIHNSNEYKYVELFINDSYEGLYMLTYPIDEKVVGMDKGITNFDEYMFKKVGYKMSEFDIENPYLEDYELSSSNPDTLGYTKLAKFYKDTLNTNDIELLYSYINTTNAIDIFIFNNFIQGIDHAKDYMLKNMYITLKEDGKVLYTPWDFDITFGNVFNAELTNLTDMYKLDPSANFVMKLNPIYRIRKLGDLSINLLMYNRYQYLRDTVLSDGNIANIIDNYESDIYDSGAFIRDMNKNKDGNYNNPKIKLNKFKTYVLERLSYLDKYMADYIGYSIK